MKRLSFIIAISTFLFSACAAQTTLTQAPAILPTSTNTSFPTLEPTTIPPTPEFRFVDIKSGGFTLLVHPELEFDIDEYSINLSDARENIIVSLNGRTYIESAYTMESFLGRYVDEMASRGGTFIQSTPYEIEIDGMSGMAVNISGIFLNVPIAGKAFVISPRKNFIIFGLGMSNLAMNKNEWSETGSNIFETLLASIRFKDEIR